MGGLQAYNQAALYSSREKKVRLNVIIATIIFFLPLSSATLTNVSANLLQPFQLSWQLTPKWGDPLILATKEAPLGTWWPDLVVDLCDLAVGTWDIPDHYDPRRLPELSRCENPSDCRVTCHWEPGIGGYKQGCGHPAKRNSLRETPFYICPRDGRTKSEEKRCGGEADYFCKEWGCETTGQASWGPSSSWDLITIARNHTGPGLNPSDGCVRFKNSRGANWFQAKGQCGNFRCNPLVIKFTQKAKTFRGWTRGRTWGLRLYMSGRDHGLIFQLKLIVKPATDVALDPNSSLKPKPPTAKPTATRLV